MTRRDPRVGSGRNRQAARPMAPTAKRYRSPPASTIHQPTCPATISDNASTITASVSASRVAPARVGRLRRATAPSTPSSSSATEARAVSGHELLGADRNSTSSAQPTTTHTSAARRTVTRSAEPICSESARRMDATRITDIPITAGSSATASRACTCPVVGLRMSRAIAVAAASMSNTTYTVKKRGAFAAAMVGAYERTLGWLSERPLAVAAQSSPPPTGSLALAPGSCAVTRSANLARAR